MSYNLKNLINSDNKDQQIIELCIKIINTIIQNEKEQKQKSQLEDIRINLSENVRFDTSDAFKTIDWSRKGYITPQDLFKFLTANQITIQMDMCKFYIFEITKGHDHLTYQNLLYILVPKFDKQAAKNCILRRFDKNNPCIKQIFKINDNHQAILNFYLKEMIAKLIFNDIQFLRLVETQKMKLAHLSDWKFMKVFKIITDSSLSLKAQNEIDQQMYINNINQNFKKRLNNFLLKNSSPKLSVEEYKIFIQRFDKSRDQKLQKEEFSDVFFPSAYLLDHQNQISYLEDIFNNFTKKNNGELDDYLLKSQDQNQNDFYEFKLEEHQFDQDHTKENYDDLKVEQNSTIDRKYLKNDPHFTNMTVNTFEPLEMRKKSQNSIEKVSLDQQINEQNQKIELSQPNQPRIFYLNGDIDPNTSLGYFGIQISKNASLNISPNKQNKIQKMDALPKKPLQQETKLRSQDLRHISENLEEEKDDLLEQFFKKTSNQINFKQNNQNSNNNDTPQKPNLYDYNFKRNQEASIIEKDLLEQFISNKQLKANIH